MSGETWRDRAACRGWPTSLFFPTAGESSALAKAVCDGCPVREECGEYALEQRIEFGVWAGAGERKRRRLRAERKPPPVDERCTVCGHLSTVTGIGLHDCTPSAAAIRQRRRRDRQRTRGLSTGDRGEVAG